MKLKIKRFNTSHELTQRGGLRVILTYHKQRIQVNDYHTAKVCWSRCGIPATGPRASGCGEGNRYLSDYNRINCKVFYFILLFYFRAECRVCDRSTYNIQHTTYTFQGCPRWHSQNILCCRYNTEYTIITRSRQKVNSATLTLGLPGLTPLPLCWAITKWNPWK